MILMLNEEKIQELDTHSSRSSKKIDALIFHSGACVKSKSLALARAVDTFFYPSQEIL